MTDAINTADILQKLTQCKRIGSDVHFYPELGSTNDIAKEFAAKGSCDGLVIITDHQLTGRGRGMGRKWDSLAGKNILMSIILDNSKGELDCDEFLVISSAISVAQGCINACMLDKDRVKLKWPNDVLVDGCKLSGILIERSSNCVIIGIGLNVNHAPVDENLRMPATSLSKLCGEDQPRQPVLVEILKTLDSIVIDYINCNCTLSDLRRQWGNNANT